MIRLGVLLGDEQRLVLAGLRCLVEEIEGVDVVGEATNGREAVDLAKALRPGLAVLDVSMKEVNGIDATALIKEALPDCGVLILSAQASDGLVRASLKAGACGFLVKDAPPVELRRAIEAFKRGECYLNATLARALRNQASQEVTIDRLSPRQRQVLQLLAEGNSMREISGKLDVSIKTVETHRAALMERIGVPHLAGLVLYAIRENLVSP
jgi:DNA-binding NarL/FixJ family response regulator